MKRGDSYAIWMGRSSWNRVAFCSFKFTFAKKHGARVDAAEQAPRPDDVATAAAVPDPLEGVPHVIGGRGDARQAKLGVPFGLGEGGVVERIGHRQHAMALIRGRDHDAQTASDIERHKAGGVALDRVDQPRRGVGIEALEQLAVADVDLVAREHARDGHDQREFGERTFVVVAHGEDGPVAVAHERDLRGLVEQLSVRLADEETAEGVGSRGSEGNGYGQQYGAGHGDSLEAKASCDQSRSGVSGARMNSAQMTGLRT